MPDTPKISMQTAPLPPLQPKTQPQTLRDIERERAAAAYSAPLRGSEHDRVTFSGPSSLQRNAEHERGGYSMPGDSQALQLRRMQEQSHGGYSDSRALQLMAPGLGQGQGASFFLASDDLILAKEIKELHHPDADARHVNVRRLLDLVEDVIESATQTVEGRALGTLALRDRAEGRITLNDLGEVTDSPLVIEKVHCEITTGPLCGYDTHATAIRVLKMLPHFSWEAKVVLTMAALALTYGDFWLLVQIYATNPLAKSMALIKGLPMILEHGAYKRTFEAINNLIKCMLETTRCIVEFGELPTSYISPEDPDVKAAFNRFPTAVYWVIRSAAAAATQISILTSQRLDVTAEAPWELTRYTQHLKTISEHLRDVLKRMHELIKGKVEEALYIRIKLLFYPPDNIPVVKDIVQALQILIGGDESVPALHDCQTKRRVHIDVLRGKYVLLLISGMDITHEELSILGHAYTELRTHGYEIVWIPVVDLNTQWTVQLEMLQGSMQWYAVHDPKIIKRAAIKFFREDWHFRGKPILVVLDPYGRVVNSNAIHMIWTWPSEAIPLTVEKEMELWKAEFWRLELLVDDVVDQRIGEWRREGKCIILYGGDNMKWIRNFTNKMKTVAQDLGVPVEMIYMGKSHQHKDVVAKLCSTIAVEQLSHCLPDSNHVWYFWTRLESIFQSKLQLHSKLQLEVTHDPNDTILQEVQRLLSFDRGHEGWVILAKGSEIHVNAHGRLALTVLEDYDKWKKEAVKEGLHKAFPAYYQKLLREEYICTWNEFPLSAKMPERMFCPDCHQEMQKFNTFRCCHENLIAASSGAEIYPSVAPYDT